MKADNLKARLDKLPFRAEKRDDTARKINRMMIGNPTLADAMVRYWRSATGGVLFPVSRKTWNGLTEEARQQLVRGKMCQIPEED